MTTRGLNFYLSYNVCKCNKTLYMSLPKKNKYINFGKIKTIALLNTNNLISGFKLYEMNNLKKNVIVVVWLNFNVVKLELFK